MWKVDENKLKKVKPAPEREIDEKSVEEWIKKKPDFLNENLLIFSQQHKFPTGEKADLIGIDENGSLVIIEIKRGKSGKDVDIQSLKYASYVSSWSYEDIENIAGGFFKDNPELLEGEEFNSLDSLLQEQFGEEFSIDSLNKRQRIIIVARNIERRIGSVLLWLHKQNVGIKAVEFESFEINGNPYLKSRDVIPAEPYAKYEVKKLEMEERPWVIDGEEWHRTKRMSEKTSELFDRLDEEIQNLFSDIDGPNWGQEFYIAYRVSGVNWLGVNTHRSLLNCDFHFRPNDFDKEELVRKLGLAEDKIEISKKKKRMRVRLKITPDYDVSSPEFVEFLKQCHKSFKKIYA